MFWLPHWCRGGLSLGRLWFLFCQLGGVPGMGPRDWIILPATQHFIQSHGRIWHCSFFCVFRTLSWQDRWQDFAECNSLTLGCLPRRLNLKKTKVTLQFSEKDTDPKIIYQLFNNGKIFNIVAFFFYMFHYIQCVISMTNSLKCLSIDVLVFYVTCIWKFRHFLNVKFHKRICIWFVVRLVPSEVQQ